MEVDTPILSRAAVPDPNLHSLLLELDTLEGRRRHYLHTSPEFPMKRLLAAGSVAIYQIARVFRGDEHGRLHLREFTLIEWYRPGFDHHRLIGEVEEFLAAVLGIDGCDRRSYADVFQSGLDLDPHTAPLSSLQDTARRVVPGFDPEQGDCREVLLDLLMSHCIAPGLGNTVPVFVYDYPAAQAAYARVRPGRPALAERFELFIAGMEIGNGYNELTDAEEQERRFVAENLRRKERQLADMPIDQHLLAALRSGLPDCAGVAVGFDRLLMVAAGVDDIAEVTAFPDG